MNKKIPKYITSKFLRENPDIIFVFGDNLVRSGKGGAAKLRDEPNTYGFLTKKYPNNKDSSFFRPKEYKSIFYREFLFLIKEIKKNKNKIYIISKLGSGLANKYRIYEKIIEPNLKRLKSLKNVIILKRYL